MSNIIWNQASPVRKAISLAFALVLALGLTPAVPASAWADEYTAAAVAEDAPFVAEGYTSVRLANGDYIVAQGAAEDAVAMIKGDSSAMYSTLQAAVDAASEGADIELLADVEESVKVPQGKSVAVDLAGHSVTNQTAAATFLNAGTLHLYDSVGGGKVVSTISIALASGNYSNTTVGIGGAENDFAIESVEGAIITGKTVGAHITVNGGTLSASDNAVIAGNGSRGFGGNTITVNGGTFRGAIVTPGYVACGIYAPNNDAVVVNGGTFEITGGAGIVARAGDVTVNGGKFETTGTATGCVGDSRIVVPCSAIVFDSDASYPGLTASSAVAVKGGVFQSDAASVSAIGDAGRISITDGAFSDASGNGVKVPEGKHLLKGSDDLYRLGDAVASIDTEYYASLADAFADAQDGDTISLLTNHGVASAIELSGNKDVTLNLMGKTLTFQGDVDGEAGSVAVKADAKLTVKTGVIYAEGTLPAFVADGGGVVTIGDSIGFTAKKGVAGLRASNGGKVIVDGATTSVSSQNASAPVIAVDGTGSEVVVASGTVNSNGFSAIDAQGKSKVVVSGGTVQTSSSGASAIQAYSSDRAESDAVAVVVSAGKVENTNSGGAIKVGGAGSLAISGGSVTAGSGVTVAAVNVYDQASLAVTGGLVSGGNTASNSLPAAVAVMSSGDNVISGGTFVSYASNTSRQPYTVGVYGGGKLSISGNPSITNNGTGFAVQSGNTRYETSGNLSISGGTFVSQSESAIGSVQNSEVEVSGGWFSGKVLVDYCADGLVPTEAVGEDPAPYTVGTMRVKAYNGSVELDPAVPKSGGTVKLKLVPNNSSDEDEANDFKLMKLVVNGEEVTGEVENGEYSFTLSEEASGASVQAYFVPASGPKAQTLAGDLVEKANAESEAPTWADLGKALSWYAAARAVDTKELADDEDNTLAKAHATAVRAAKNSLESITSLNMTGQAIDEGATLPDLSALANLETLNLSNTGVQDVSGLGELAQLKSLDLSDNALQSLEGLADVAPGLESLTLSNTEIQAEAVSALNEISTLNTLDVSNNPQLKSVAALASSQSLTSLNVSDTGLSSLAAIPVTQALVARNLDLSTAEAPLQALLQMAQMESFDPQDTKWDLRGSKLYDDEGTVTALAGVFADDAASNFVQPTVLLSGVRLSSNGEPVDKLQVALLGQPATLTAAAQPAHASVSRPAAWSSSNSSVVSVGDNGELTYVGAGEATITAAMTDEAGGTKQATCTVTVSKAAASLEVSIAGWTYGNQPSSPTFNSSITDNRVPVYTYSTSRDGTYSATVPTDAGTYYLKGELAETDTYAAVEDVCEFAIAKAGISPAVAIQGWVYGDEPNAPTLEGNAGNAAVTYEYAPAGGTEYTTQVPSAVGNYVLRATVGESDNYNRAVCDTDFSIAKAAIKPTVALEGWTYGQAANNPVLSGNEGNASVSYSYATAEGEPVDGVPTQAGNYMVTAAVEATDSYESAECSSSFVIARATVQPSVSISGWPYGSDANEARVSGVPDDAEYVIQYRNAEGAVLASAPQDAGDYTVKVIVNQTNNYNAAESELASFSIARSAAEVTVAPVATQWLFNGTPQTLVVPGRANGGTLVYWLEGHEADASEAVPTAVAVGNYRVYYRVVGDANHTDTVAEAVDVSIGKGVPTVAAPVPVGGLVYNGHEQVLVEPSMPVGGTIEYTIDAINWSSELPVAINAGTHWVFYRIVGSDGYDTVSFDQAVETYIAPAPISPSISIEGWAYGETPNAPVIEGNAGQGLVVYDYRNLATGEVMQGAPSEVGSYEVSARIAASGNFASGQTDAAQFSVSPAKVSEAPIPEPVDDLVYSGQPQALVEVEQVPGVIVELSGDDGQTWGPQVPTGIDAGSYTVLYRLSSESSFEFAEDVQTEGSVTVEIARARFMPVLRIQGWTYGEPANQPSLASNPGNGEVTYAYFPIDTYEDNPFPTAENGIVLDAGTYVAYVTVEATQNYERGTATREFVVRPAQVSVTAPTAREGLVFDGSDKQLVNPGSTTGGAMVYSLDGETYSTDLPMAAGPGVYAVYYKVDGGVNYASTQPASVWVTIAAPSDDAIAPTAKSQLTYNGEAQQLVDPAQGAEGQVEYALDGGEWSTELPVAANAGAYAVSYRLAGSELDVADAPSVAVTIAKAPIAPQVSIQGWTYGQPANAPAIEGNDGAADVLYEYTLADRDAYSPDAPQNAGDYLVRATVPATDNFEGAQAFASFAIEKAAPSVLAPAAVDDLAYTGQPQPLVSAGSARGGIVEYSLDGREYTQGVPAATDAGSYTVYYRVKGDGNHTDVEAQAIEVVIGKASAQLGETPQVAAGLAYTGAAQALVTAPQVEGGSVEYSLDGYNWSQAIPTGEDAGSYKVWYRVVGDQNHDSSGIAEGPLAVSIAKAAISPSLAMAGWTYGQTASQPQVTGNAGNADVSFAYASYPSGEPLAGVPSNVGVYTVVATVQESANYLGATTSPLAFAISMADAAVVTAPAALQGLTYTGAAQQLVSAGSAQGTELQYSLDGGAWTTSVPTATVAGTYTVRYRAPGDANHNATPEASIAATIGRANVTVAANNASKTAGASDPALTASVTGLVNGESATRISYTLSRAAGETAGTYAISAAGNAIQGNYNVAYRNGVFTINPAPANSTSSGSSSTPSAAQTPSSTATSASAASASGATSPSARTSTSTQPSASTQSGAGDSASSATTGSGSTVREATVGTTGTPASTGTAGTGATVVYRTVGTTGTAASAGTNGATAGTSASADDDDADDADDANGADGADDDDDAVPETSGDTPEAAEAADDEAEEDRDASQDGDAPESIDDEANPLASGLDFDEDEDEAIADDPAPLAAGSAEPWSPFNLVASLFAVGVAIALGAREISRRREDGRKAQVALALVSLLPAIAACVFQVATQAPSETLAVFNSMSPLFGVAALASAAIAGVSVFTDRDEDYEDYSLAY